MRRNVSVACSCSVNHAVGAPPATCVQAAFRAALDRFEYQGAYRGVFPVKANHDKALIQAIMDYGAGQCLGWGWAGPMCAGLGPLSSRTCGAFHLGA